MKKYCYEVHANTPDGKKVTFPVADSDQEAINIAYTTFPRGSRVTKLVNQDTGKETNF